MSSSWLYSQDSIWIVLTLLVATVAAGELGSHMGRRWYPRTDEHRRGHIGSILGALLGLLALLISFTFAMSADRYNTRRQLVVNDANALERLYLQSSLLPAAPRRAFKQLLGQYVNSRAQIALLRHDPTDSETAEDAARSERIHAQMWNVIKGAAESQTDVTVTHDMLNGLIDAMSIHRERVFSWESHVPDPVIWLLLFGALTAVGAIGFVGGLGNHRGLPARIVVTLLLCGTIYVTLDLDKPHQGPIIISQSPMLHLKSTLDGDPETRP
jgi:hypothetical protein